jgi:putative DeoR family transcriptional regulator (stage III sporulation protein D)
VSSGAYPLKDYIEDRAVELAEYILETKATVRQAAKKFGVSKSTVHTVVTKQNGFCGR